ncbi:MAG TPA: type II and III secretion system protein family protein [Anaeromyxobacteraceae bacterium]|nr:type II and III secretion system protein family protein [Anaeromyxobacteraceae bacterium]
MTLRYLPLLLIAVAGAASVQAQHPQTPPQAPPQQPAGMLQPTPVLRISREVGSFREMVLEAGQNRLLVLSDEIGRIAVADPEVADLKVVTPMQVLLTAKGVGSTDLTLWTRGNDPLVIALRVTRNLEGLRKQLKELFPNEQVSISTAGDLVVLTGEVSDVRMPERIAEVARLHSDKVANLVKVSGDQQVQLEVRFAEVSRSGLRQLGVNLFHKSENFKWVGGMFNPNVYPGDFLNTTTNPAIPGTGPRGLAGPGFPPDVPAAPFANAFNFFVSGFDEFPISGMLSLLEGNGLAKVLAEPTLVTLTGQEARFLAGGEIPIPFSSTFGNVSVEWKKFGIILRFTPTVIAGTSINLRLAAEVSDIDPSLAVTVGGNTIPGLTSRQSETTVRLGDGQSFAIAGLLSDQTRSQIDRVPLLGDIPILGALFRSTSFQKNETELLVVVTARIVEPVAPHELPPLPTDYENNNPTDLALFLLGIEGRQVEPRPASATVPASGAARPRGATGFER